MEALAAWWARTKPFVIKQFLPLGLVVCFAVALAWPAPGDALASWKEGDFRVVQTALVCYIFVVSGVTLKTEDIKNALTAYAATMYGLAAILLLTPMLGFIAIEVPFRPSEFQVGLAVFCCVPTTLTSGVTLATQAKGNAALALMLTVCSNLLGVLTVPFTLKLVVDSGDASIDAVALLVKLTISILVPLIVGKTLREASAAVRSFVTKYKVEVGLSNNSALLLVVWQNLSRSRDDLIECSAGEVFAILFAGVVLHFVFLAVNWCATTLLRLPEKERRATLIMTSQKTLPVAVTVIAYLDEGQVGRHGLIAIPCIIGHMSQLFIDAYIVSKWAEIDPEGEGGAAKPLQESAPPADGVSSEAAEAAESGEARA